MKGYWIAHVDVTDPERYAQYAKRAPEAFAAFGGKFLARGGRAQAQEGRSTPERNVVIEFPSYQAALDCYGSEAYQEASSYRAGAAHSEVIIVEGMDI